MGISGCKLFKCRYSAPFLANTRIGASHSQFMVHMKIGVLEKEHVVNLFYRLERSVALSGGS